MAFKFDISQKGKTFHADAEAESIIGKKLGEKVNGEEIMPELKGYELVITGASDKSGFPSKKDMEGPNVKRILLKKGFGMKEKKKGLILRKSIRGNTISADVVQINLNVTKAGSKPLAEIFKKEGKEETAKEAKDEAKAETKPEEKAEEHKKEEKK